MLYTFEYIKDLKDDFSREELSTMNSLCELLQKRTNIDNPMSSSKIIMELYNHKIKLSDIRIRKMVHALRLFYPIGSVKKGYYWIFSEEEFEPSLKHLQQRENSIREAKQSLLNLKYIFGFMIDGQRELNL